MPKNNPLDEVTFDHLTEACPKMTRRLRRGVAAELVAWLVMHHARWQAQADALPRPSGSDADGWIASMRIMLESRCQAVALLVAAAGDKFRTIEWNAATDNVAGRLRGSDEAIRDTAFPVEFPADLPLAEEAGDE